MQPGSWKGEANYPMFQLAGELTKENRASVKPPPYSAIASVVFVGSGEEATETRFSQVVFEGV